MKQPDLIALSTAPAFPEGSRRFVSYAPIVLSDANVLPNGDVETEIDILELVPQEQKGGAGKFHVAAATADEMVRNFAEEASRAYRPPFVLGHPMKEVTGPDGKKRQVPDEAAPAVGWLTSLRRVGTRLRAGVRLLKDFAERVRKGEFLYVSPEFAFSAFSSTGEEQGGKVFRVGVTNTPHQRGADGLPVGMFQLAEAPGEQAQESSMDPETKKMLEDFGARLKALEDKCASLGSAPPKEGEEAEEMKAKLAALTEQVTTLGAKLEALPGGITAKDLETRAAEVKGLAATLDAEIKKLATLATSQGEALKTLTETQAKKDAGVFLADLVAKGKVSGAQLGENWPADPVGAVARLGFVSLATATQFYAGVPDNSIVPLGERRGSPGNEPAGDVDDASLARTGLLQKHGGDRVKAAAEYKQLVSLGSN